MKQGASCAGVTWNSAEAQTLAVTAATRFARVSSILWWCGADAPHAALSMPRVWALPGGSSSSCSTGVSSCIPCAVLATGVFQYLLVLSLARVNGMYADGLWNTHPALLLLLVVINALQLGPILDTEDADDDPGELSSARPTPPAKQQKRQQDKLRHQQPQHVQQVVQDANGSLAAAPTTPAAMKAAAAVAAAARASLCNGCSSKSSIDVRAPQDAAANADAWAVTMPREEGQQGAAAREQEAEQIIQEQQVLLMQRCRCSADSGSSSCRTSSDTQQQHQQQPLQPDIELGKC